MRKPDFGLCETDYCEADQRLCIRHSDNTALLLINPKFQAFSHPLCLYRPAYFYRLISRLGF